MKRSLSVPALLATSLPLAALEDPASHYIVSGGEGISCYGTLELQNDGSEYLVRRIR